MQRPNTDTNKEAGTVSTGDYGRYSTHAPVFGTLISLRNVSEGTTENAKYDTALVTPSSPLQPAKASPCLLLTRGLSALSFLSRGCVLRGRLPQEERKSVRAAVVSYLKAMLVRMIV